MVKEVYAVMSHHDFDSESRLEGLFSTEADAERVVEALEVARSHLGLSCHIEPHSVEEADSFINGIEY